MLSTGKVFGFSQWNKVLTLLELLTCLIEMNLLVQWLVYQEKYGQW